MKEDWDNLIILDACRFDYFKECCEFESGKLDYRVSMGSTSWEFMTGNFVGRELYDTVYVTGNPFVAELPDQPFHTTIPAFEDWDSEIETVPPKPIADLVREAVQSYPQKRLIAHFMQPHDPYIGPYGRELTESVGGAGWSPRHVDHDQSGRDRVIHTAKNGEVSDDNLRVAYRENVNIVLDVVGELLDDLKGKTVITADHGELLGERLLALKRYEHPGGVLCEELRKVPWYIVEDENRRQITPSPPEDPPAFDDEMVEQRLSALGYR